MSKVLQHLVSKQKKRIQISGFDLDLTYITDQIIAMGLPASGVTGIYRNPQSEVIRFLDTFHEGSFKVYNLCSRPQDQYDPAKFGGRVAAFPFEDHGVPPLKLVDTLAESVKEWLAPSRDRVVCIHCLAGKGRTGLMVCAALMKLGLIKSGREAMAFYGERRMKNKKGVTQASQRRWVEYYEQLLNIETLDLGVKRTLRSIELEGCTTKMMVRLLGGGETLLFESEVFSDGRLDVSWEMSEDACIRICDEEGKELGQMWIHAAFVHAPVLECSYRWWDVSHKNSKAKKLFKRHDVRVTFEDDGTFTEGGGATYLPVTDKEYRAVSGGEYDELEPTDDTLDDSACEDDDEWGYSDVDEPSDPSSPRKRSIKAQGEQSARESPLPSPRMGPACSPSSATPDNTEPLAPLGTALSMGRMRELEGALAKSRDSKRASSYARAIKTRAATVLRGLGRSGRSTTIRSVSGSSMGESIGRRSGEDDYQMMIVSRPVSVGDATQPAAPQGATQLSSLREEVSFLRSSAAEALTRCQTMGVGTSRLSKLALAASPAPAVEAPAPAAPAPPKADPATLLVVVHDEELF